MAEETFALDVKIASARIIDYKLLVARARARLRVRLPSREPAPLLMQMTRTRESAKNRLTVWRKKMPLLRGVLFYFFFFSAVTGQTI